MNRPIPLILAGALILAGTAPAAFAQGAGGTPPAAAPAQPATPETGTAPGAQQPSRSLSKKLSNTNGVIAPPKTGDAMAEAPPANAAKTPVIAPPGSPGGNPAVQPK
jgi:hypothetical protein